MTGHPPREWATPGLIDEDEWATHALVGRVMSAAPHALSVIQRLDPRLSRAEKHGQRTDSSHDPNG